MSRRRFLTDQRWARLQPVLPPQKPRTGRPPLDHRLVLEAILWVLRTGAPWRDLPPEYGPWQTAATRFYRWVGDGSWERILAALQRQADAEGDLDWRLHHVDGSTIRAHQHAAGARRPAGSAAPDPEAEALGRSRGGFSTKLHVRAEGGGKPVALLVTAGQRHEQAVFPQLMERGAVKRPGRGRPRVRPDRVVGDKGYSSPAVRRYLRRRGIGAVVPARRDQRRSPAFDRAAYRERNVVERLIARLKQFRRVATRYEKRAANYLAMLTIAAIILWL
jgi:transposase